MTSLNFDKLISTESGSNHGMPPVLALDHLDTLWLQVTGTLCNLACLHCLISCGPQNDSHPFMSLEQVKDALAWAEKQGVKDYYFTGGEPFMHPDIQAMILATLEKGPLTILTNGVLIDEALAKWLAQTFQESRYSLDIRVSLDGITPEENDVIRGRHTFEKIFAGIDHLWHAGINPVITVTTCHADLADSTGRQRFYDFVRSRGINKPRLKFMAPFKIGREERRAGGYLPYERLVEGDLSEGGDHLQCVNSRMITAKGVYPCPILIEVEESRMGDEYDNALASIKLEHPACYTCHVEGVTCRT